jgi:hypothetical protein
MSDQAIQDLTVRFTIKTLNEEKYSGYRYSHKVLTEHQYQVCLEYLHRVSRNDLLGCLQISEQLLKIGVFKYLDEMIGDWSFNNEDTKLIEQKHIDHGSHLLRQIEESRKVKPQ